MARGGLSIEGEEGDDLAEKIYLYSGLEVKRNCNCNSARIMHARNENRRMGDEI